MLGGAADGSRHQIEGLSRRLIEAQIGGRLTNGAHQLDEPNVFQKRQVDRRFHNHHEFAGIDLHNDFALSRLPRPENTNPRGRVQ